MRSTVAALLILFCAACLLFWWKQSSTSSKKALPLFLEHETFIEGIGLKSLGKHFLLRHKEDRELFLCAKQRMHQAKKQWVEGKRASIPHVIHSIWIASETVPEDLLQAQASLKKAHPDCRFMIWDKKGVMNLIPPQEVSLFATLPLSIQKEIATAAILYHNGGVVLDSDIQCLAPFQELFSVGNWIVTFEPPLEKSLYGRHVWLSSAFMAATQKNAAIFAWMERMFAYFRTHEFLQKNDKKLLLEGVLLPLISQFTSEQDGLAVALPATCFIPIAPRFLRAYLKKLAGEKEKEKKAHACMSMVRAPFSKIARESFGLHRKGGRLGELLRSQK